MRYNVRIEHLLDREHAAEFKTAVAPDAAFPILVGIYLPWQTPIVFKLNDRASFEGLVDLMHTKAVEWHRFDSAKGYA